MSLRVWMAELMAEQKAFDPNDGKGGISGLFLWVKSPGRRAYQRSEPVEERRPKVIKWSVYLS